MPTIALQCGRCGSPVSEADQYCLHCGRALLRRAPIIERIEVRGHLETPRGTFGRAPLAPRLSAHLVDITLTLTLGFVIWVVYFADYRRGYNVPLEVATVTAVLGAIMGCNAAGWSPGKRAVGIRIVTSDGRRPGFGRGLLRLFGAVTGLLPLGLGHLSAAWHPEARAWHDRLSGTHAVWTEETLSEHLSRSPRPERAEHPSPRGRTTRQDPRDRSERATLGSLQHKRTYVLLSAAHQAPSETERRTQWSPPRSSPAPSH